MPVCSGSDVENPYMRKGAPGSSAPSVQDRVVKELKSNWWLWGSIVFAVLLVGSLVVFRENLYDSAKHGLPFLAGISHLLACLFHYTKIQLVVCSFWI